MNVSEVMNLFFELTPEIKAHIQQWINVLRANTYRQCTGQLQIPDKACCCLGVLCLTIIPESLLARQQGGHITGGLPNDQRYAPTWIKDINSDFAERTGVKLIHLNDSAKWSFHKIADALEAVYIRGETLDLRPLLDNAAIGSVKA